MKITITVPYLGADTQYFLWGHEEEKIDFRKEKDRADRCTICFAACELEHYLNILGFEAVVSDRIGADFNIQLAMTENVAGEEYTIQKEDNGILVDGNGRMGVLYGAYEVLKCQGIYWLTPWDEIVPEAANKLLIPEEKHYKPSFPMGRGYSFDGMKKEAESIWLWMARNKMNVAPRRPWKPKLQEKLGIIFEMGGHVLESTKILDPDYIMPSGKSMWEEHEDWFGTPADGKKIKSRAQKVGFCVSNDEALEYVSGRLLEMLQGPWYNAERLAIWGFDTWGGICQCEDCKKLGNGTDHSLRWLSYTKEYLDKAYERGELDRRITLVGCAYEGTSDLAAPSRPVPENLKNSAEVLISFCPINRCYVHAFADDACDYNREYRNRLEGWNDINIRINEYYNVTKFEDLPFLYTKTMIPDLRYYYQQGVTGMVYMHLPMMHWDVKNLTQVLFAELCWDVNIDCDDLLNKYFLYRYGRQAETMKKVYELMEEAGRYCANWRAWGGFSILSKLLFWDGCKPSCQLEPEIHMGENAVKIGMDSVELYAEAISLLEKALHEAENDYFNQINCSQKEIVTAVNPAQAALSFETDPYVERIRLDLIYANYGKDCMELISLFVSYHDALYHGAECEDIFARIEELATKMSRYYIPLRYEDPAIEVFCDDALRRCQLNVLYYKCKAYRKAQAENTKCL